ncbi:MAG TPA: succinylglutamate desuccinylase/aspartoacylase family protein [Kiloniellales bacterium]|nr:succinylglutamate desuccinylase/aspartoacylase family protein [Kiloniellales bacterium]
MDSGASSPRSIISASIDLNAQGKHFGHIRIPFSRDDAGLGYLLVPLISIRNGDGPCILLNAGTHGDEFEGQIALRNLAHSLRVEEVSGHILMVPSANLPAVVNNSRCSPIDQLNLNRVYPGRPGGSVTEKMASYVLDELVYRANFVLDLHAGGTNYGCVIYTMMHRYAKPATTRATFEMMKAFRAPYGVVFDTEPDRDGMLDTAVEDRDKPFIAVELGGSGIVTPQSVAFTVHGVRNVLIHCGLLRGEPAPGQPETQVLGVPAGGFVLAEDHGIFEPFVELDEVIESGAAVGQLHSIHRPDRAPIVHRIKDGGRVICRRSTGTTTHGDFLIVTGTPLHDPGF